MIRYHCDGCGAEIPKDALRYQVKIDVHAAYDELVVGLMDLVRNHRAEIVALIEQLKNKDPQQLEEAIYKRFTLDLCPSCQRAYIRDPIRFHPEQAELHASIDIDAFLRSLGANQENGDHDRPNT